MRDAVKEAMTETEESITKLAQELKKDLEHRWGTRQDDPCLGVRGSNVLKGRMIEQVLAAGLNPACHFGEGHIAGIYDELLVDSVMEERYASCCGHMEAHTKEVAWTLLDQSHVRDYAPKPKPRQPDGAAGGGHGAEQPAEGALAGARGARGGVAGGRKQPPSGGGQVWGGNANILGLAWGAGRGVISNPEPQIPNPKPTTPNPTGRP